MFFTAFLVAFVTWPALVVSLSIQLTPSQRNVTRGETTEFHYKPKDDTVSTPISLTHYDGAKGFTQRTNVTVIDTLTNKTYHIIDNAVNGTVKWAVPDDLEVRGGYFYVASRKVNNATITVTSDSEFQVLEKPRPKPSKAPGDKGVGAMLHPVGIVGSVLLAGLAVLGL
ncbi:uncharacterized protein N0V89_008473 [Didymosphaeria variabile]|uniref:Uncharacterized protein n=1 Tax=Didymosphaeria variabile TaxID=1932322 RepID=A0A9W8XFT8_9PLEO|nr:uncharacterized protein N0V89_008473 [Didymosphaeria variabile]KAJ4349854.1 hypothetical protein N0V89_008473 [Didymosphaeria variabile]